MSSTPDDPEKLTSEIVYMKDLWETEVKPPEGSSLPTPASLKKLDEIILSGAVDKVEHWQVEYAVEDTHGMTAEEMFAAGYVPVYDGPMGKDGTMPALIGRAYLARCTPPGSPGEPMVEVTLTPSNKEPSDAG